MSFPRSVDKDSAPLRSLERSDGTAVPSPGRSAHETIYRHIWRDKRRGGTRYKLLRQAGKKRRKRYGAYDSRGRLAGKRHISERPASVETRTHIGHWEIDTVLGPGRPCIVTSSSV